MGHCRHFVHVLGTLLVVLWLTSCWGEPQYPSLLVEVDSLLMRSEYEQADSLMQTYKPHRESYPVLMYHRLLDAGLQYKYGQLTTDFATLDSLTRFYDGYGTPDKHAKAVLYLGYFYYKNHDYPAALSSYLQVLAEANKTNDVRLLAWAYNQIGRVYYEQAMFAECIEPYRQFYHYAYLSGDKRQMALASNEMGIVHTYNNNVDSAIYSYMHAIELANNKAYADSIISYSKYALADIYIQIEEFDSAAMFIHRDTLNWVNWAFWHEAQGHNDSAAYYYRLSLQTEPNLYNRLFRYKQLAQLDQLRGDQPTALADLKQVAALNDSIKQQSREAETRQAQAQHEYQQLKLERDEAAFWNLVSLAGFAALGILLITLFFWVKSIMKARKHEHELELSQERQLRQEEEHKNQESQDQLMANKTIIEQMEQQLAAAQQQNNTTETDRLRLKKELLEAHNRIIEVNQQRKAIDQKEVEDSGLIERIRLKAGQDKYHLTDGEWQQVRQYVDAVHSDFTRRLLNLAELSEQEMQVCYLTKLGIPTTSAAVMLFKSKSAISMMRKRMYYKLTRKQGSATDFETFINGF